MKICKMFLGLASIFVSFAISQVTCEERTQCDGSHFDKLSMSNRLEPVYGKTFFGSEKLLKSINPELEHFKAVFTLPKHATYFSGTHQEINTDLASTNFTNIESVFIFISKCDGNPENIDYSNLQSVQELWFVGDSPCAGIWILLDDRLQCTLKRLHVIQTAQTPNLLDGLNNIISICNNLQVLDIQNVLVLDQIYDIHNASYHTMNTITQRLFNSKLQVLSLQNIKGSHMQTFSFKHTCSSGMDCLCSVEYLSLKDSKNINFIPGPMISLFPNLQVLDVSTSGITLDKVVDLMRSCKTEDVSYCLTEQYLWLMELFSLHPSLKLLSIEENAEANTRYPNNVNYDFLSSGFDALRIDRKQRAGQTQYWPDWFQPSLFLTDCLNRSSHANMPQAHFQCEMIKCIFNEPFFPCSKNPLLEYDRKCKNGIRIPVSPKLHEINTALKIWSKLTFIDFITFTSWWQSKRNAFTSEICFAENSIQSIVSRVIDNDDKTFVSSALNNSNGLSGLDNLGVLHLENFDPEALLKHTIPSKIKDLSLPYNSLIIPDDLQICAKLPLLENFDISSNEFDSLPPMLFHNCKSLKFVDLSNNRFTKISSLIHNDFVKYSIHINLSQNPLFCNCHKDAIETIRRLQDDAHRFHGVQDYLCQGLDDIQLVSHVDIESHVDRCIDWLASEIAILVVGCCLGVAVLCVTIFLCFQCRYRIITFIYRLRTCLKCGEKPRYGNSQDYPFDIYLAYCFEDGDWVHNSLLQELEVKHAFNCCVHYRDFPASGILTDVILRHMRMSKDIIFVISEDAIRKRWPKYELEIAQDLERLEGKRVFYIIRGELGNNIPSKVRQVLQARVYMRWPDTGDQTQVDNFYSKLIGTIHGHALCGTRCCCLGTASKIIIPPMSHDHFEQDHSVVV